MQTPTRPEELTARWLTSVLAARGLDRCTVTSCDTQLLRGEQGMTGDLVRLRLAYEEESGLPETLIAKFSAAEPSLRSLISALGHYERELNFYASLAARTPVPTPRCYFADHDTTTGFTLLLLEDVDARNGNSITGCSVDDVARVLSTLARLHAAWWQAPELADASWLRLRHLVAPGAMVDAFDRGWPSFVEKLSIPVSPQIREMGSWIRESLPTATATLFDSGPRTLIHNDVQADNLFFSEVSSTVVLIDWQMATFARCVIDVAMCIRGSLDPTHRRAIEPRLLRDYHDTLVANGVHDYPFEQCVADYHLAAVLTPARLAYAVGLSDGLHAHPGAFWDALFPRFGD
jgi:aminoglycoside phosphotransferase (APT) family kinase protein